MPFPVAFIICIKPVAFDLETAPALKRDSALITEYIKFELKETVTHKIKKKGFFKLKEKSIEIKKATKYHPSFFINDKNAIESLNKNINKQAYIDFIREISLVHLFHEKMEHVNYGIILEIKPNKLKIFIFAKKQILDFTIAYDNILEFKKEDFVVIEQNNTIHIVEKHYKCFIKSEIIYINNERKEGFIRKINPHGIKDYFFQFKNCNFLPNYGDVVLFIPTINPYKNYKNEPIAINIIKI